MHFALSNYIQRSGINSHLMISKRKTSSFQNKLRYYSFKSEWKSKVIGGIALSILAGGMYKSINVAPPDTWEKWTLIASHQVEGRY